MFASVARAITSPAAVQLQLDPEVPGVAVGVLVDVSAGVGVGDVVSVGSTVLAAVGPPDCWTVGIAEALWLEGVAGGGAAWAAATRLKLFRPSTGAK